MEHLGNSLRLKMDGWKTNLSFWHFDLFSDFSGAMCYCQGGYDFDRVLLVGWLVYIALAHAHIF